MGKLSYTDGVQRALCRLTATKTRGLVGKLKWMMRIDELFAANPDCLAAIALPAIPAPTKPPSTFWRHGFWFKLDFIGVDEVGERTYRLRLGIDPDKTPRARRKRPKAAAKKTAVKVVKRSAAKKAAARKRASSVQKAKGKKKSNGRAPARSARPATGPHQPKQTDTSGSGNKHSAAILYKKKWDVRQVQQLRHALGAAMSSFAFSVVNMARTTRRWLDRAQRAFDSCVDRMLGVTSAPRDPNWFFTLAAEIPTSALAAGARLERWAGRIPGADVLYTLVKRKPAPFDWVSFWQSCPFGPPEESELSTA